MKDWFMRNRHAFLAVLIVTCTWATIATVIPRGMLDLIIYGLFGWYVMGGVYIPWVEKKLKRLL